MAKDTKKPYKFRQARKDAKAGAKGVFTGKRKAAVKDITTKQTLEEREALKELSDARKRQKAGKADFIIDDRGNRVEVKPTETAQERFARDRAEARAEALRKYPLDENEIEKQKARKARMEAKNKAAIAKQEADRAARRGRNTPTLQQTPANEKPLSRKVKKPAKGIGGTAGTVAKPKPGLSEQIKKDIAKVNAKKAAASKNKPIDKRLRKVTTNGRTIFVDKETGQRNLRIDEETPTQKSSVKKGMTRAEKSAANKAAWAKMTPAERKNWSTSKPGAALPKMSMAEMKAQNKKALDGLKKDIEAVKKPKGEVLIQGKKYNVASGAADKKMAELRKQQTPKSVPSTRTNAPKVNPKYAVAVRQKAGEVVAKQAISQGAKKAGAAAALKGAGRIAGKLVGGKVGLGIAAASLVGKPVLKFLTQEPAGSTANKKPKDYSVRKEAMAKVKKDYSVRRQAVRPIVGAGGSTYTVQKGDTLSGIAKANNTTLAAIREVNPTLMKNKKYKQGNIIFSGTKVKLPKK